MQFLQLHQPSWQTLPLPTTRMIDRITPCRYFNGFPIGGLKFC